METPPGIGRVASISSLLWSVLNLMSIQNCDCVIIFPKISRRNLLIAISIKWDLPPSCFHSVILKWFTISNTFPYTHFSQYLMLDKALAWLWEGLRPGGECDRVFRGNYEVEFYQQLFRNFLRQLSLINSMTVDWQLPRKGGDICVLAAVTADTSPEFLC